MGVGVRFAVEFEFEAEFALEQTARWRLMIASSRGTVMFAIGGVGVILFGP